METERCCQHYRFDDRADLYCHLGDSAHKRIEKHHADATTAAWRSKPSWMLVATKDRTINPDLERWYADRAKSHKVEVEGASHSVYVSRPKEVAALIEEAASHAR